MAFTEKQIQDQLQIIAETENPNAKTSPNWIYPQEIQDFTKLADQTERTLEVDGYPFTVYQFVDRGLDTNGKAPIFISIHGGGWVKPHKKNDLYYSAFMAHKIHGIVLSPDYTTSDLADWRVMTKQCYATALYAAQHAGELGGDPENISVGGYSAGGHLTVGVTMQSLATGAFKVRKQILCYAPLCFLKNQAEEPAHATSPERMVRRGIAFEKLLTREEDAFYSDSASNPWVLMDDEMKRMPETLMITAEHCQFHEEDEAFAQRLIANGVLTTSKRYLESHHGFIPHFFDEWEDAVELLTDFIKK